jgi:prophage DNA circulation protein
MATIQEVAPSPWRMQLVPASFAGVQYHVEQQARSGGRRVVLHEYPKRDTPYAEDMGRAATRYQITGYLIGPSYNFTKRELMTALDSSSGGTLVDPYLAEPKLCICERYNVTETRERGGYCTFEMTFTEVGNPGNIFAQVSSAFQTQTQASATGQAAAANVDTPNVVAPSGAGGIGHA